MANTPNNSIPLVDSGTLDPSSAYNAALDVIDSYLQVGIESMELSAPPTSPAPTDGQRWIVGTAPSGAWAGQARKLAKYVANGSSWEFLPTPKYFFNKEDDNFYCFDGTNFFKIGDSSSQSSSTVVDVLAPTFAAAGAYQAVVTGSTLTIPLDGTYTVGQYIIICVMHRGALTLPSGWTLGFTTPGFPGSGITQYTSFIYRRYQSGDPTSVNLVQSISNDRIEGFWLSFNLDAAYTMDFSNKDYFASSVSATVVSYPIPAIKSAHGGLILLVMSSITSPTAGWAPVFQKNIAFTIAVAGSNTQRLGAGYAASTLGNIGFGTISDGGSNAGLIAVEMIGVK